MTSPSLALTDTATMLRRDVRHAVRFPMLTISGLIMPVLFLLLFDGDLVALSAAATSTTCSPASS